MAKHDARMLREQKESRRMKAIKKEFQERRAKEHAERKKERDKNILIIEKKISIFERIQNYFKRSL